MAEFEAFHPENQTLGRAIMVTIEATQYRNIDPLLAKHGLAKLEPENWYSQPADLALLEDINNTMDFVAIGMKIPDRVEYGVPVKTVGDALTLLDNGYRHNHRGPDVGGFHTTWTGDRSLQIVCHTPYPSDLEYGIIYRLVQKYRPVDSGLFSVMRTPDTPNRKLGADTCTFDVSW
ncbi:MAG: hypothetical protein AAF787_03840 [Chloroflexota bacterium]